jgi:hypothetical protein
MISSCTLGEQECRCPKQTAQLMIRKWRAGVPSGRSMEADNPAMWCKSIRRKNEKAARQQGDLLFSRENSSNGRQKSVKTFLNKIL